MSNDIYKAKIDALATIGDVVKLVGISPIHEWKDNKPTDQILGYKYTVVSEAMAYEKVDVKIDGKKLLEMPDEFPIVEFQGLEMSIKPVKKIPTLITTAKGIAIKAKNYDKAMKV